MKIRPNILQREWLYNSILLKTHYWIINRRHRRVKNNNKTYTKVVEVSSQTLFDQEILITGSTKLTRKVFKTPSTRFWMKVRIYLKTICVQNSLRCNSSQCKTTDPTHASTMSTWIPTFLFKIVWTKNLYKSQPSESNVLLWVLSRNKRTNKA